jgi:transposase
MSNGRPGIDPEAAVRLMLAGFFQGVVHDRKLMREAQVNYQPDVSSTMQKTISSNARQVKY